MLMLSFVFDKFGKVILVYSALAVQLGLYPYNNGFAKIRAGWSVIMVLWQFLDEKLNIFFDAGPRTGKSYCQ